MILTVFIIATAALALLIRLVMRMQPTPLKAKLRWGLTTLMALAAPILLISFWAWVDILTTFSWCFWGTVDSKDLSTSCLRPEWFEGSLFILAETSTAFLFVVVTSFIAPTRRILVGVAALASGILLHYVLILGSLCSIRLGQPPCQVADIILTYGSGVFALALVSILSQQPEHESAQS